MNASLNGRLIYDIEIDGIDHRDCPDYCDAYVASARWKDTDQELTDSELDDLTDSNQFYEILMSYLH